jgi:two-component system CheB/CheR fusion protein
VFATDIDPQGIAIARTGIYPASVAADLTTERLGRFFTSEPDGASYRIHKSIRDMLVLSEQDLIRDPPFSRLDLVSCRNLLIYMGGELQQKLIPLFHYALNPGGFLFQGTSETIGDFNDLFLPVDRKAKLFQRKEALLSSRPTDLGPVLPRPVPRGPGRPVLPDLGVPLPRPTLRGLTEQALLQQLDHSACLVDERGDIFYQHGRTGQFLEPAPGETGVSNLLKMAREGLRDDLSSALHRAAQSGTVVACRDLRVKTNGDYSRVDVRVHPVAGGTGDRPESPLFLVVFELLGPYDQPPAPAALAQAVPRTEADLRVEVLRQELRAKEEYLKASNEQLETSNEELKSANEEMQSVNEELQSTNEELETSKEELQSVNEELATVNAELQTKVLDLSRANNDMNNLLAGTGIATVFVDHQLRLLRFTPAATRIINLISSDVGRPVGHIVSNLVGYDRLVADLREVLDQLAPKEVEVHTAEGRWYCLRIQLYRTLDNVIEGAVITFLDISERKRTELALRRSEGLFRLLGGALPQLVWTWDTEGGRCDYVSPRLAEFTGVPEALLLGRPWLEQVHPDDRSRLRAGWEAGAASGEGFEAPARLRHHSGDYRAFTVRLMFLRSGDDRPGTWIGLAMEADNP